MNQITLKNYRCFRNEQSARLAPLTLLVGENSTGKTSFMAMLRALWNVAVAFQVPDFKEDPYDLGSFDEIAHHRGGRVGRADTFEAGFDAAASIVRGDNKKDQPYHFEASFARRGTIPYPVRRQFARGDTWFEERFEPDGPDMLHVGTERGVWERQVPDRARAWFGRHENQMLPSLFFLRMSAGDDGQPEDAEFSSFRGKQPFGPEDLDLLENLAFDFNHLTPPPFASAPVRSKPRRTYDPSRPTPDPEGDSIPMFLADLFFQKNRRWATLKRRLERFGQEAGLFDEISIRSLGNRGSEPFQVQIRKSGGGLKGTKRNLIDVGYGVSQVLPIITELLRQDAQTMFLLQQPEVHLHPSAQAALGSLFCQIAGPERQLVVETHSDHLIDRVRMDVRDRKSDLLPNDVSLLFFERGDLDVTIHSIGIDEDGNIVGAPDSYRRFFMEETARSLWNR